MRGHTKFLGGVEKNRGGKAFRGPVTEGCSYKADPIWNRTVPVSNPSGVNRVDQIPNGYEHIRSLVWLLFSLLALFSFSKALNFARACN